MEDFMIAEAIGTGCLILMERMKQPVNAPYPRQRNIQTCTDAAIKLVRQVY